MAMVEVVMAGGGKGSDEDGGGDNDGGFGVGKLIFKQNLFI